MKHILTRIFLGLVLTAPLHAEMNHAGMDHAAMSGMQSDGVVRKVDKRQGKLTLRHGPLENLDMPAMTMVFRVTDPAWLDQVKPGDNVRFRADRVNGMLTVTAIDIIH
jgi:Cu/Ag efflux protein CusF